jgi:ABC-2 type transport system permease protein
VTGRVEDLTGAIVLQQLVPLVIILVAFGAFASERERGTLPHLASLGVSRGQLLAGKWLGAAATCGLLLLGSTLVVVGVAWSGWSRSELSIPADAAVLLLLAYSAYWAGFVSLSLGVSAIARTSRIALVALLGFWAINVLLAPRVAAELSKQLVPTPSATEFEARIARDIAQGMDGHNPEDRRRQALRDELLRKHGVQRVEDLPFNFAGVALQASEEYENQVHDRHFDDLWDEYERQGRLQQSLGLIAPLLAIRFVSMALSGTDIAHYRHFAEAAEQYRRRMVKALNDDLAQRSRAGEEYFGDRRLWERVPDFTYDTPGAAWVLAHHRVALIALVFWAAGATGLALVCVRRMSML